jgi:hypothetical protein
VFSRTWTGLSGYIPLRNEGRSQEEEAYFALSVSLSLLSSALLHWASGSMQRVGDGEMVKEVLTG